MRESLSAGEGADDRALSRALIAGVAAADVARLERTEPARLSASEPRESQLPAPVAGPDRSFLGRLQSEGSRAGQQSLAELGHVPTLLAVLRAGSLWQRRVAARRLAERLSEDDLDTEDRHQIQEVLEHLLDVEIAPELRACQQLLSGPRAKDALETAQEVRSLAGKLETNVRRYWEGDSSEDPLLGLSGDARALLLLHARELSDLVLAHVAALIEGNTTSIDVELQRSVLSAVRYAGDTRLVASLVSLLEERESSMVIEAARAISRIDDPRVWPALLRAYERSVVDIERIALGAALGRFGDVRAADYVRAQLRSQDRHVLVRAIEALRTVGGPEDVPAVLPFLRGDDHVLSSKAAHTLGRIADGRALLELVRVARESSSGALRAAAEEAADQTRARLVLRGEEPPGEGGLVLSTERDRDTEPTLPSFGVRLRSFRHYLSGRIWLILGATGRALARFEAAASCRPDWALPIIVAGLMHAARDEYAQALALFRRAIEVERARVERNPLLIRAVARCFLRRSEQVERDGRLAIARGLLDEVLALDLRRAPSSLRFEIGRRHETLRVLGAG
ncbi:MAG: HEAT repeat domain-containing protein [Myxococcales bacterium]